jgi:hypothetical protein
MTRSFDYCEVPTLPSTKFLNLTNAMADAATAHRKKQIQPLQRHQPARTLSSADDSDSTTPREPSESSSPMNPGSNIPAFEKPKKLCRKFCLQGNVMALRRPLKSRTKTIAGKCPHEEGCIYRHDASKRALCSAAAMRTHCSLGSKCLLEHSPNPHNLYHCVFFLQGLCVNLDCAFLHRAVSGDAVACRSFATSGYCELGDECEEVHVQPCMWASTGYCGHWTCKLVRPRAQKPTDTTEEDSEPERLLGGGKTSMTPKQFVKHLAGEAFVAPIGVAENAFAPDQDLILFE